MSSGHDCSPGSCRGGIPAAVWVKLNGTEFWRVRLTTIAWTPVPTVELVVV